MKFLLLAAVAAVAAPALAQPAPPPGARPMGDRVQTRAAVVQRVQRMFAMIDTNRDGVLDQAELAAVGKGWEGQRGKAGDAAEQAGADTPREPLDRNAVFDQIDSNHDGAISRDEFARAPMPGHHGGMRGAGGQSGEKHGMKGRGGGMAGLFAMADADRDGRVTLKEATDAALRHFDMADTNHDGQLSPEERAAARGSMRGQ